MPNHSGFCSCKLWTLHVTTASALNELNPRVCDCDYCKTHPSAIISNPDILIELLGHRDNLIAEMNGDQLATFYRCKACGDFLAVGAVIGNELRGAVNSLLLIERGSLGASKAIQPRLLSSGEKIERWGKLWGKLNGV